MGLKSCTWVNVWKIVCWAYYWVSKPATQPTKHVAHMSHITACWTWGWEWLSPSFCYRLRSQDYKARKGQSQYSHTIHKIRLTGAGGSESVSGSVVSDSLATPWTVAHQAPLSVGFSRQDYWSGLPCPSPGDLPYPVIEPGSPHCRQILYHLSYQASPVHLNKSYFIICLKSVVKALQKLPSAQNLRNDPFFPKYPKWLRSLNLKYTWSGSFISRRSLCRVITQAHFRWFLQVLWIQFWTSRSSACPGVSTCRTNEVP